MFRSNTDIKSLNVNNTFKLGTNSDPPKCLYLYNYKKY